MLINDACYYVKLRKKTKAKNKNSKQQESWLLADNLF